MINALVELSARDKDYATFDILNWFVRSQVEEEKQVSEVLAQIRMIGDVPAHLAYIDRHVGKRAD